MPSRPGTASVAWATFRRGRLDRGLLGDIAVRVDSARQAVALLNHAPPRGLRRAETRKVRVTTDQGEIPVGINGERCGWPPRCGARADPAPCGCACSRTGPGSGRPAATSTRRHSGPVAMGRSPDAHGTGNGADGTSPPARSHHERTPPATGPQA